MKLLEEMRIRMDSLDSVFQKVLMRQDIERLEKLVTMVPEYEDRGKFVADGMKIGWTQNDLQTFKMNDSLSAFLRHFHDLNGAPDTPETEDALIESWREFHHDRMKKLVGCL